MNTHNILHMLSEFCKEDLQFSNTTPTDEQQLLFRFYKLILPNFQHLKLRKLKLHTTDQRFCDIYIHYLLPYLKLYLQFGPEYWEQLKLNRMWGELEECKELVARKRRLKKVWFDTYSKPTKQMLEAK